MSVGKHHTQEMLIRVKSGTSDDTLYAGGATVPDDDDCGDFSALVPFNSGKGHSSEVELFVESVDADEVVQARGSCTFTLNIQRVVTRSAKADDGGLGPGVLPVAVATAPLTGQTLQTSIRVPWNGGKMYVGFASVASAPAGHDHFNVWAKPVAG